MMKFWINGKDGMPFFFITSSVNETMLEMLDNAIMPQLLKIHVITDEQQKKMDDLHRHLIVKITVRRFLSD